MTVPKKTAVRVPQMVLGWREQVGLPDLGVPTIKAKLDTGAKSSSLHVTDVENFRKRGADWVRFRIVRDLKGRRRPVLSEAHVVDRRVVRNSSGKAQARLVIETTLEICGFRWPIELTLADRPDLNFRMLLGREALSHHIIVDPARSYAAGRRKTLRRKA